MFLVHTNKFTTNDHHRPLVIKTEYKKTIDLVFSQMTIEQVLLNQGFKWSKTASKEKVAKIKVPYPINKNDEFDLKAQKEIAHKYMKIEEIKEIINKEIKEIEEIKIDYE